MLCIWKWTGPWVLSGGWGCAHGRQTWGTKQALWGSGTGMGVRGSLHSLPETKGSTAAGLCPAWGRGARACSPQDVTGSLERSMLSPPPRAHSSAVGALQLALVRGGSEEVVQRVELERGWESLRTSVGHEEGVARLAR